MKEIQVEIIRVQNQSIINYSYLVHCNGSAYLIDPAWDFKKINEIILDKRLNLVGILLTHHHFDHVNLSSSFSKHYDIPVYMSEIEVNTYGFKSEKLRTFSVSQSLFLEGIELKTYHCPGHTKGSACYSIEKNFFSGDVLFVEGCGFCEGYGASPYDSFETLKLLRSTLTHDMLIYPGHRYRSEIPKRFDYLLENNIYLQIKDIDKFVQFRMGSNINNFSFM